MTSRPTVLWLRRDLRLDDHSALASAAAEGPVVPVHVIDPAHSAEWGAASRWWLAQSLQAYARALEAKGSRLVIVRGPSAPTLLAIANQVGARAVHLMHATGTEAQEREVHTRLTAAGVACRRFAGNLLHDPATLRSGSGGFFKVYSAFARAFHASGPARAPVPAPDRIAAPAHWPVGLEVAELGLTPNAPDWSGGLAEAWRPGEAGATERLDAFLDGPVARYHLDRDRPDFASTSRLSPHLAFGEIGPARIWQRAALVAEREPQAGRGVAKLQAELLWREFSYHLLAHVPDLPSVPLRPEFARFPWSDDARRLRAWQRGRTGYPIVDAGMRELWRTGWMHNRVRMIVASLLVKDLLVPWQQGAAWFWDTLVDADLANNSASWQWVAGSGADAAPFFRIFNPVTQSRKFDPEGVYLRRHVPELARLPDEHIHAPWLAPREVLARAGVELGTSYPHPIVDHAQAREHALAAFAALKAPDPAAAR